YEDQHLTYVGLNARANQLAQYLRQLGVGPEALAGIYLERSLEMIVGILGILKSGGAYVPLDPGLPKERLRVTLNESRPLGLLTDRRLTGQLSEHDAHVIRLDADWKIIAQSSAANFISGVTPQNPAYVIFTSGSTGFPKGVAVEHHALLNYLNGIQEKID